MGMMGAKNIDLLLGLAQVFQQDLPKNAEGKPDIAKTVANCIFAVNNAHQQNKKS